MNIVRSFADLDVNIELTDETVSMDDEFDYQVFEMMMNRRENRFLTKTCLLFE